MSAIITKAFSLGKTVAIFRRQIPVAFVGVRNLTKVTHPGYSSRHNAGSVRKGFDYEKHPFKGLQVWYKSTAPILNDNSKLIVVDSPVGLSADREHFANKLAEWYDMKIFPDVTMEDVMVINKGTPGEYDYRLFNDKLPRHLQFLDFEMLYTSKTLEEALPFVRTQLLIMEERLKRYHKAISHVLNTGQGVIMLRSWYDDMCFTHALYKMKVFSSNEYKQYMKMVAATSQELLCPHLIINLDAPVSYCMEQIEKRGRPYEQNSIILTEKFLEAYNYKYRNHVLHLQDDFSIIMKYNVTNMPDWEYIEETFDDLTLDGPIKNDERKFLEWEYPMDSDTTDHRRHYSSALKYNVEDEFRFSFKDCFLNLEIAGPDFDIMQEVVYDHPALHYGKGHEPKYHGTDPLI